MRLAPHACMIPHAATPCAPLHVGALWQRSLAATAMSSCVSNTPLLAQAPAPHASHALVRSRPRARRVSVTHNEATSPYGFAMHTSALFVGSSEKFRAKKAAATTTSTTNNDGRSKGICDGRSKGHKATNGAVDGETEVRAGKADKTREATWATKRHPWTCLDRRSRSASWRIEERS